MFDPPVYFPVVPELAEVIPKVAAGGPATGKSAGVGTQLAGPQPLGGKILAGVQGGQEFGL